MTVFERSFQAKNILFLKKTLYFRTSSCYERYLCPKFRSQDRCFKILIHWMHQCARNLIPLDGDRQYRRDHLMFPVSLKNWFPWNTFFPIMACTSRVELATNNVTAVKIWTRSTVWSASSVDLLRTMSRLLNLRAFELIAQCRVKCRRYLNFYFEHRSAYLAVEIPKIATISHRRILISIKNKF